MQDSLFLSDDLIFQNQLIVLRMFSLLKSDLHT